MSNAVRLTVVPEAAQVALGEQLSLALQVQHTGPSGAHYRLDVSGIPADWYTLDRPYFALQPAASAQVLLSVHPPARPVTIAGRYTLTVQVRAAEDPNLKAAAVVALTLRTSGGVDMDVQPAEAVGSTGVFRVTFLNQMTSPVDVALTAHDAKNALHFRFEPEGPVVVPATGVAGPVTVYVAPRTPELLSEPHAYEIEFHSLDLGSLQRNEQRARFVYVPRYPTGRLPVWLRRAPGRAGLYSLLLLLLLLVVVGSRALAHPATRPAVTPPPAPTPTRAASPVPPTRPRATPQGPAPIPSIERFTLVHGRRGQPYELVWQVRGATRVTLNGRPVATRDRVVLRAPLHSTTYRLVATTGARGATASLRLVVDGHTPDQHAFVVTTPEIATFAVLRSKGQLEAIWRVRDAVHVWLQGRLVSSSGAARVPAGATWLRLVASNDVGSRQRLLHLAPPATPRPRPTATPTAPPTATPVPPPTATPTARPTATPVPPPTATPTARPATPTPRPTRTPTPVSVTVGTTRPPALSRRPAVPTPRPSATPTPVSVTIGSAAPRGAAVMPTPTAVTVTWP